MNHIYRIVWNTATACYQAVTENAKGQGKSQGKSAVVPGNRQIAQKTAGRALTATALGAALYMLSLPGFAGPTGGQVTAGSATINQAGSATTINQTSNKAAIDWAKFSVGSSESVRFNQPGASSITLNRVTGAESSAIMGKVSANGQIFILNPNGVLFGAGAQVNVGGLVASTLRLDNANFMAGNYKFSGDATGSVINNGSITVAPGGTLALMAPVVQNTGTLSAPSGSVLLAGAQGVTLTLQTDGGLLAYTLDSGSVQALVDNGGLIQASGGHVVLSAKGVDALSKAVVNHSGVIEAQTVGSKSGVIELLGDMQSGTVNLSGKLDASAPNLDGKGGNGGYIDTSAANVQIANATSVTTASATGKTGMWLIDPTDFTIEAGSAPRTTSRMGAGTLTGSLANTDITVATTATGAGNGDIFVNSEVSWAANRLTLTAHRNININANLNGSGSAKLALEYGSEYVLNGGTVNLPAGQNFSTKVGGAVKNYIVITELGAPGSTTGTDLQGLNGNLSGNFVLGKDVNASATAGWNGGKGFVPIGTRSAPFTGQFNGLGHTVSNIEVIRPTATDVGLFGANSGSITNVGVINGNFQGGNGAYDNVGGLIGYNNGVIKNTFSSSSSSGTGGSNIGGLVGWNNSNGISSNSYATGEVKGGGIIAGGVTAAGGLVGWNFGQIINSYAATEVSALTGAYAGGLVGKQGALTPITSSNYWDTQVSGQTTSAGGTGKTTTQMSQQSTYAGWDFVNTWVMLPGNTYPTLRNSPVNVAAVAPPVVPVAPLPEVTLQATAPLPNAVTPKVVVAAQVISAPPQAATLPATTGQSPTTPVTAVIAPSEAARPVTVPALPANPVAALAPVKSIVGSAPPGIGNIICSNFGVCGAQSSKSNISQNSTSTELTFFGRKDLYYKSLPFIGDIYNYYGYAIDGYNQNISADGTAHLSFPVLNTIPSTLAIQVFDKNGNLLDAKYAAPNLADGAIDNLSNAISDQYSGEVGLRATAVSEKTDISIIVPKDGYVRFTYATKEALLKNFADPVLSAVLNQLSLGDGRSVADRQLRAVITSLINDAFTPIAESVLKGEPVSLNEFKKIALGLENKITPIASAIVDGFAEGSLKTKASRLIRRGVKEAFFWDDLLVIGMNLISAGMNLSSDRSAYEVTFSNN